jgi:hypothetical protein
MLNSNMGLAQLCEGTDGRLPARRLPLALVMDALRTNQSPAARTTLVSLAVSATFTNSLPRLELLLRALASVNPPPSEVLRLWKQQSQPDAPFRHIVVDALVENGSEPALALLGRIFTDPGHDDEEKVAWMRGPLLRHRNDVLLLLGCEKLLTNGLPLTLRAALVEALCDYRPRSWYTVEPPPKPPARDQASPEARAVLCRICEFALKTLPLKSQLRNAVEQTRSELARAH